VLTFTFSPRFVCDAEWERFRSVTVGSEWHPMSVKLHLARNRGSDLQSWFIEYILVMWMKFVTTYT